MKTFLKFIAISLCIKLLFFVGGAFNTKVSEKPAIERFVNEFVINNPQINYPVKVDNISTLRGRELITKAGVYYVVEDMQMNVARESFTIPYESVGGMVKEQAQPAICKQFSEGREKLFKGYSEVGLIQRIVDVNEKLVAEVVFHISDC